MVALDSVKSVILLNVGLGEYGVVKLIAENSLSAPVVILDALITNKYWVDGDKGAVGMGKLDSEEVATLVTLIISAL